MTFTYHELPGSSSTPETTQQLQSPAEVYLDDDRYKDMRVGVSFYIFCGFAVAAAQMWDDLGHWNTVALTAIVSLYVAVMINLLLIKRRNKKRQELEACELIIIRGAELTPMFMLATTVVIVVCLGVAVFIFRPDRLDMAYVAFCSSLSTAMSFLFIKIMEHEQKRALTTKCEGVPCLV